MAAALFLALAFAFVTSAGQGRRVSAFKGRRYRITSSKKGKTSADLDLIREGLPKMGLPISGEDVFNFYYIYTPTRDHTLHHKATFIVFDDLGSTGAKLSLDDIEPLP